MRSSSGVNNWEAAQVQPTRHATPHQHAGPCTFAAVQRLQLPLDSQRVWNFADDEPAHTAKAVSERTNRAMSDETTPLNAVPGPLHVFPGGVSPRTRRSKMLRFQCLIGFSILVALVGALIIVLAIGNYMQDDENAEGTLFIVEDGTGNGSAVLHGRAPLADEPETRWSPQHEPQRTEGDRALDAGIKALGDRELLEEGLQPVATNTPAFRHFRSLNSNPEARKLARRGYIEGASTHTVARLLNYTKPLGQRSNIGRGPRIELPDVTLQFDCDFNERYRRANGVCNNRAQPRLWGAALVPYRRMVAPDYADGISEPRASHNSTGGGALPTARNVSLRIHRAAYETDSNFTVMLAVFGQLLDHDITATSLSVAQEGESINCCTPTNRTTPRHPECFPMPIATDDPYYHRFNVSCINFVRSAPAPTGHFGPRQQLNQATAFIDGSVVYGNSEHQTRSLRSGVNGTLRMYVAEDGRELLPLSTDIFDGCNRDQMLRVGKYCFESGDSRANENLLLTSMHLLWARHHNYLARGLQRQNPDWSDEQLFQEARKILAAQMAHITYNEFLPVLFGPKLAAEKGLLSSVDNPQAKDTYDPLVDPTIANAFAAAGFRFAHSLLPKLFRITRDNSTPDAIELHTILFNPFSLWTKQGIDDALFAAANTSVQRVDRFFSLEVTERLFEGTVGEQPPICGLDLVSLNIQRGRDHGLPSYPVFRRHCHLPPVDTWEQMAKALDANSLQSIRQIYLSPDDVDVYTGALSEPPMDEGAIFGPLLTCLVSDQFMRLKIGDSHWYERKVGPQRFTKDQLNEIYNTSLAKIMCINSDALQEVRTFVMEKWQPLRNEYFKCIATELFNFKPWSSSQVQPQLHRADFSRASSSVRSIKKANINNTSAIPVELNEIRNKQ